MSLIHFDAMRLPGHCQELRKEVRRAKAAMLAFKDEWRLATQVTPSQARPGRA